MIGDRSLAAALRKQAANLPLVASLGGLGSTSCSGSSGTTAAGSGSIADGIT
jgi:hypothetical protein